MTYRQALAALEARQETRVELGLDRVRRVLKRLGDPQDKVPCFHVAGTNGKGSTCAMLAATLKAGGYKTGLYTSPHLVDVRERIQINGRAISKNGFAQVISRVLAAEKSERLSYFELLTAAAFLCFFEDSVTAAVLETGLGGRLDATNVVSRPLAAIITSIDFDHMDWLGNTLAKIAGEKAAIAKKDCPLISAPLAPEAMRVVKAAARKTGAPLTVAAPWKTIKTGWAKGEQMLRSPLGPLRVALLGQRQGSNAALVGEALRYARVPPGALARGLRNVRWPGRFEVRRLGAKTAVLDGAHNPEAMAHLVRTWRLSAWAGRPARWIIGLLKDKDAKALLAPLGPLLREAVAVEPPSPRALGAAELAKLLRQSAPRARVTVEPDAETAVRRWRRDSAAPRTAVICGSFYLVGRATKVLGGTGHA